MKKRTVLLIALLLGVIVGASLLQFVLLAG